MTGQQPKAATLSERHQQELDALLSMLELSEGTFSLSIAVCNSPALRDRLIDQVRAQRPDVERVDLAAGLIDVYGFVKEHAQPGQSCGLMVTGLEASVSSRDTDNLTLRSLNASRDLWEPQFPRPIVFWLPEYAARELTTEAIDFTRYLSHRFGFTDDAFVLPPVDRSLPGASWMMANQLSSSEKRSRIGELQSRLAAADRTNPRILPNLTNWTQELAYLLAMAGETQAAEQVCRDLLPLARSHPDEPASALLWGMIADILQTRGELEEALRIRCVEELPVYERLGYMRGIAILLGKIANILSSLGEYTAALNMLRNESLPLFEQLGDVNGKTIALGKIADILTAQGNLDEALRIRRDEQLPVYEKLGDVRANAVTHGKIAGILTARGDLNEALRIRRDEELPVYEQIGATRDLLVSRTDVALLLLARNAPGDRDEAAELLRQALVAAEQMGIPEADQIREIMDCEGF
jgi:tetratricopeptide (TPR) repeat protein